MQIHELNTFTGNLGDTDYLAVDSGFDTAKISGTDLLKPAKQALDKAGELESFKVNLPIDNNNQPDYGNPGDTLRTKGNKETEWAAVGLPTDEQTAQAVQDWLDDHPEATTSVQDHSLTHEKLVNGTLGFVTPQMFGAKGDGLTDDTAAFSNCFNGLYKKILIPQGEYIISNTITIPDDTVVACIGTIKKSGTFDILFDIGNNCDIQLIIDIDKASETDFASQTSADIHIDGKQNVRIHDTKILNSNSRYVMWVEKCSHIVIDHCFIDTYVYAGIGCRDGNVDVKILSNSVLNGHGIQTNRYPIILNSSAGVNQIVSRNIVCDGNYIEDQIPCWEAIDAHDLRDAVISNNTIINTVTGISIVAVNQASNNIVINGNAYKCDKTLNVAASTFGIICALANGSKNVVISNNVLMGCGNNAGTTDKGGIKLYGIDDAIVTNNVVQCIDGNGIDIASTVQYPFTDFKINNNTIEGANIGINIINSNGVDVYGEIFNNLIKNCTTGLSGNQQYNTRFEHVVYAKDNEFKDCTTNFTNNAKGTLVSPSYALSSGYGKVGMELQNLSVTAGRHKAICYQAGNGNNIAQWMYIYDIVPIKGRYTLNSSGYVDIADSRISSIALAIAAVDYYNSASPGQTANVKVTGTGQIRVFVTNADGTPVSGDVSLSILIASDPRV